MFFANNAVFIFSVSSMLIFVSAVVFIFYEFERFKRRNVVAQLNDYLVVGKKSHITLSKKDLFFLTINKNIMSAISFLLSKLNFLNQVRDRLKSKTRAAGLISNLAPVYVVISKVILSAVFAFIALYNSAYIMEGTSTFVFNSTLGFGIFGFYLPNIWLYNLFSKRRAEVTRNWSDMLDVVLISLTSGRSLEASLQQAIGELKDSSPILSRELTILLTELVIMEKRVDAYRRLPTRLPFSFVKNFVADVVQAELHGTPLSKAIRQISSDNRAERIQIVERKAASLGPKLTVPMIVFFFPLLFAVIITPAVIGAP